MVSRWRGRFMTVVSSVGVILVSNVPALQPVTVFPDASTWGYGVEGAVEKMKNGTPMNIVIYGQSVSERIPVDQLSAELKALHPDANLSITNISIGACTASAGDCDQSCICSGLKNNAGKLSAFQAADLVIFHVYGWEVGFRGLYDYFEQNLKSGAEMAIWNNHAPAGDTTSDHTNVYNRYISRCFQKEECDVRGWAYIDVMTPWYAYLDEYGLQTTSILVDGIHPNGDGSLLLAKIIAAYFTSGPGDDTTPPQIAKVESMSPTRIRVSFSERMNPVSLADASRYSLGNGASVVSALPIRYAQQVILGTTPLSAGEATLVVNGVTDRSPNANSVAAGTQAAFAVNTSDEWRFSDIGTVGRPGVLEGDPASGPITIQSYADNVNTWKSELSYCYLPAYGDCEIQARVTSVNGQNENRCAGVALRRHSGYHSEFVMAGVKGTGELEVLSRSGVEKDIASVSGGSGSAPAWVKIARTGTTITAYRSSDGSSWTTMESYEMALGDEVTVGAYAFAGNYIDFCTAGFEELAAITNTPTVSFVVHRTMRAAPSSAETVFSSNLLQVLGVPANVSTLALYRLDGSLVKSVLVRNGTAMFNTEGLAESVFVLRGGGISRTVMR